MTMIPALSVHQPWAWAICANHKPIENRTWATQHRGPLLIHASKSVETINDIRMYQKSLLPNGKKMPDALIRGCLIGLCYLEGCEVYNERKHASPFAGGPICWLLKYGVAFREPIPYTGNVGLFQVPITIFRKQLLTIPDEKLRRLSFPRVGQ